MTIELSHPERKLGCSPESERERERDPLLDIPMGVFSINPILLREV
jgi:hypothetical protein